MNSIPSTIKFSNKDGGSAIMDDQFYSEDKFATEAQVQSKSRERDAATQEDNGSQMAVNFVDKTASSAIKNPQKNKNPEIPLNLISLQALLNTLITRGLVTAQELSAAEKAIRLQKDQQWMEFGAEKQPDLEIEHPREKYVPKRTSRAPKYYWLRKRMSRHRWSRRLATALFGWKFKRVSRAPEQRKHH